MDMPHFSFIKKILQKVGSKFVSLISGSDIQDAVSGFRAFSRGAAMKFVSFSDFSHTVDIIIQCREKGISILNIPISVNAPLRESRLFSGMGVYLRKMIQTIFHIIFIYKPLKVFFIIGSILIFFGVILGARYIYYIFAGYGQGHIQSLILMAILTVIGFQCFILGLLANLIAVNRRLIEEIFSRVRDGACNKKEEGVINAETNNLNNNEK